MAFRIGRKGSLAGIFWLCAGFVAQGRVGVAIYDNTGPWLLGYGFTALQQGDEVHASGTERLVTRLTIGVSRQNSPGTADLQARLYANDGSNGAPGSLLWQSALLNDVTLSGGVQLINFDVPLIFVPDVFTWTLQASDSTVAVGLITADPPSIGSSPPYDWFGGPVGWTKLNYSNWMARVEAVPEPAGIALFAAAGLFLSLRRTSRRTAIA